MPSRALGRAAVPLRVPGVTRFPAGARPAAHHAAGVMSQRGARGISKASSESESGKPRQRPADGAGSTRSKVSPPLPARIHVAAAETVQEDVVAIAARADAFL